MCKHKSINEPLRDVIYSPNFGNLAKLIVLIILSVGFVISAVIVAVNSGDVNSYAEAAKIFGGFVIAAISGGATATFGKSETAKTIIAQENYQKHLSETTVEEPPASFVYKGPRIDEEIANN